MKNVYIFLILIFSTVLFTSKVNAQGVLNTVTIEPSIVNIDIFDDKSSSIITLTNQYDSEIKLVAEINGIENNTGRIIPSNDIDPVVADSLKLSETQFTIPPHSKHFLTVTVNDSQDLSPGGHYATIVFTDNTEDNNTSSVRLQLSVGVFITKKQGEDKSIELKKHKFKRNWFQFPEFAQVEFINNGNVHLTPRGYLRIYDNNYVYYETILNSQSNVILPDLLYTQNFKIDIKDSGWLPKKITTELGYRADGIENSKFLREEFWYIPIRFMVMLGLGIVNLIIFGSIFVRKYKRRRS